MYVQRLILLFFAISHPKSVLPRDVPSFMQHRKILAIEYDENCDGKIYPFHHANISFIRNGAYTLVSGVGIAARDFYTPNPGEVKITKCEDKSDRNTCKPYTAFKWRNTCELNEAVPLISPFMNEVQPPMTCPIKKGMYRLRNVKFPTETVAALLPQKNANKVLWILKMTIMEGRETIACFETGLRVAIARNRQ